MGAGLGDPCRAGRPRQAARPGPAAEALQALPARRETGSRRDAWAAGASRGDAPVPDGRADAACGALGRRAACRHHDPDAAAASPARTRSAHAAHRPDAERATAASRRRRTGAHRRRIERRPLRRPAAGQHAVLEKRAATAGHLRPPSARRCSSPPSAPQPTITCGTGPRQPPAAGHQAALPATRPRSVGPGAGRTAGRLVDRARDHSSRIAAACAALTPCRGRCAPAGRRDGRQASPGRNAGPAPRGRRAMGPAHCPRSHAGVGRRLAHRCAARCASTRSPARPECHRPEAADDVPWRGRAGATGPPFRNPRTVAFTRAPRRAGQGSTGAAGPHPDGVLAAAAGLGCGSGCIARPCRSPLPGAGCCTRRLTNRPGASAGSERRRCTAAPGIVGSDSRSTPVLGDGAGTALPPLAPCGPWTGSPSPMVDAPARAARFRRDLLRRRAHGEGAKASPAGGAQAGAWAPADARADAGHGPAGHSPPSPSTGAGGTHAAPG